MRHLRCATDAWPTRARVAFRVRWRGVCLRVVYDGLIDDWCDGRRGVRSDDPEADVEVPLRSVGSARGCGRPRAGRSLETRRFGQFDARRPVAWPIPPRVVSRRPVLVTSRLHVEGGSFCVARYALLPLRLWGSIGQLEATPFVESHSSMRHRQRGPISRSGGLAGVRCVDRSTGSVRIC